MRPLKSRRAADASLSKSCAIFPFFLFFLSLLFPFHFFLRNLSASVLRRVFKGIVRYFLRLLGSLGIARRINACASRGEAAKTDAFESSGLAASSVTSNSRTQARIMIYHRERIAARCECCSIKFLTVAARPKRAIPRGRSEARGEARPLFCFSERKT